MPLSLIETWPFRYHFRHPTMLRIIRSFNAVCHLQTSHKQENHQARKIEKKTSMHPAVYLIAGVVSQGT